MSQSLAPGGYREPKKQERKANTAAIEEPRYGYDHGSPTEDGAELHREHLRFNDGKRAYPIASWVKASQWHPVPDRPILIWRASFTPDDFPVYGRYCSCHGRYIYDNGAWMKNDITGEIEPVVVEPGDVTYWRDAYSGPQGG